MRFITILLGMLISVIAVAQPRYNAALLDTLTFIASTKTPSQHFAGLYYNAIEITNNYAATQPDSVRRFIFGFEERFAPAFFTSYKNLNTHTPQIYCWQPYYTDTTLNDLQYKFIGMTAHINGDMWVALKDTYSYDTLKKYKKPLLKFQQALNVLFDSMYVTSAKYPKLRRLRFLTLGLDRLIGKKVILYWRKRQVQMALLYYSNPAKCERKNRRLKNTIRRWHRFAVKWIK